MSTLELTLEAIFRHKRDARFWLSSANHEMCGDTPQQLLNRGQERIVQVVLLSQLGNIIGHEKKEVN